MYGTKSEILLNKILKNVGLINTTPYSFNAESNPYSTKTERILYLIELHTRGLAPLIDDLRLNKEFYFDFQTADYANFTVPFNCTVLSIDADISLNPILYNATNNSTVQVDNHLNKLDSIKITTDHPGLLTLKLRIDDNI